jgi:hypothetical protein
MQGVKEEWRYSSTNFPLPHWMKVTGQTIYFTHGKEPSILFGQ